MAAVSESSPAATRRRGALIAASVFLVALCLRPALTAVGPLLPQLGADEGLGESALGLLGALPLIAFGLASPLVHRLSGRFGMERAVFWSLLVLAVGSVVRSYTGHVGLWLGTVVIGASIAVGNVLVPVLIKRDYAGHVSRATGVYTAFITGGAAIASAVAVPVAAGSDWRLALAIWGGLALIVAVIRLPAGRAAATVAPEATTGPPLVSVWRQPMAWLVTFYMGLQSTSFYVLVTWLPTIEISTGVSERTAGIHLFLFQCFGLIGGLSIPRLMKNPSTQRAGAITASVPIAIALLGLLLAPGLVVVWAVVAGLGQGAALVAALSLISIRGRTHHETTQLSGMAQSIGYLLAATGPALAGYLTEQTGEWTASLTVFIALAVVQVCVGAAAARDTSTAA
ncbi:MFS transporter [Kribbella sp. CA-293567]|uniref:MFS transporter n=1 Tax=Kribbella sp. CA-293567 TaxID=3002436 RepID=UPI0022DD7681|nr:MFS transporter [Kribbella sp. CA-293567]WBQ08189.1 MFS transporter [Kribbella sp. CA-293567]